MLSRIIISTLVTLLLLTSCSAGSKNAYPRTKEEVRDERYGKLTGREGIVLFGGKQKYANAGITVNSFLWRAALDVVSFMPLITVDPFGGVIATDWYQDPSVPGERYRLNVIITSGYLRADALKITAFKQKIKAGIWQDVTPNADFTRILEDKILSRARILKIYESK